MDIQKESFGKLPDGKEVDLYTLSNDNGVEAKIANYGGIITSLKTPDKQGHFADIVLGHDNLDGYLKDNSPYFGAIIGRVANRIAKGKFVLDGRDYILATNASDNHLHGGTIGFDKVVWNAEEIKNTDSVSLKLTCRSPDGDEGYPGNLNCVVIYTLTNDDELKIGYEATTDKTTIVNLTNHSYFNLAGFDSGDVYDHQLWIDADKYTAVDGDLMPTGEIESVKDTPLDFTKPESIGSRIEQAGGYDNNYVINDWDGSLKKIAKVTEPATGRTMGVLTTEPGVQLYSGNFLNGSITGKGAVYNKHGGFCLETQHFSDAPNQPSFPSIVLKPGEKYAQTTIYKFTVEK